MTEYPSMARYAWGIGHVLGGLFFFFAIIGVFGLKFAIASLILFVCNALVSFVRTREQEG